MLSCKEVATALASGEAERGGLRGRLAIRWHLLLCAACRTYARQMRRLGEAARSLLGREPTDPAALARLEEELVARCRAGDRNADTPL